MCKQLKKKRIQIHPEVILFLWILLNTYFHLQLLVQIQCFISKFSLTIYRKTSSRGAYRHDPFWSVFGEYFTWFHKIRWYNDIIYNINSAVVISVVVESSRCSSKTLQKGSCPYAPLDKALRYGTQFAVVLKCRVSEALLGCIEGRMLLLQLGKFTMYYCCKYQREKTLGFVSRNRPSPKCHGN